MKQEGDYANFIDGKDSYTAILTIKKTPTDTVYFQFNDSITVYPRDYQYGYDHMQRVICGISVYKEKYGSFDYIGEVDWLEYIDEGKFTSDASVMGSDGLTVLDDWMTGVEDGFMTIHYTTMWGNNPVQHDFSLVSGTNPDDPYELELRHDANGDAKEQEGESIISFDINSLPDTGGEYKTLTLKWTTSGGSASKKEFQFKTRK